MAAAPGLAVASADVRIEELVEAGQLGPAAALAGSALAGARLAPATLGYVAHHLGSAGDHGTAFALLREGLSLCPATRTC